MRNSAPLLAICAALAGCSTSGPNLSDTITVTSNPTAAAVRLNGQAVGRTPTKVTLDRTKTYEMSVGKGGFLPESITLRPKAINTKKGVEFGFPETVQFTLTKVPAPGDPTVPAQDTEEFRKLVKRTNGDTIEEEGGGLKADLNAVAEASRRMQDPAVQPKTPEAKETFESALKALQARAAELEKEIDAGKSKLKADSDKQLASIQQALEEQKGAAAKAREELDAARADAAAKIAAAQKSSDAKAAEEAKAAKEAATQAEAKAKAAEAKLAAANKSAADARKKADDEARAAEAANAAKAEAEAKAKAAEEMAAKAEANARLEAEAKVAKVQQDADAAKAAATKASAAEFSARFALLEYRRQSKKITPEEYAEQLAALRKKFGE